MMTKAQRKVLAEAVLFTREEWRQMDDDPDFRRRLKVLDRAWQQVSPDMSLTEAAGYVPTGNSYGEYSKSTPTEGDHD